MRRPLEGIRVIEPERSDEAKGFAEKLAAMPPLAVQWTKAATNSHLRAMVGVGMDVSLSMVSRLPKAA